MRLADGDVDLIAFRMLAYKPENRHRKRQTWEWLIGALRAVQPRRAVLIGAT